MGCPPCCTLQEVGHPMPLLHLYYVMSKYLKWAGVVILTPVLLFAIISILLYFPPFQRWAVKQVTAYASDRYDMHISVEQVSLRFPLDLSLDEVKVMQPNDSLPSVTDTVAHIRRVVADVQLLPLFRRQVMVDQLSFDQLNVNTANFIHTVRIKGQVGHLDVQAHGIDLGRQWVNVDQALLSDARLNIELSDTVPPDTTPSTNFWKIRIARLKTLNTHLTLHLPGDTLSVSATLGHAVARHAYLDLYKNLYQVQHLDWQQGAVRYDRNFEPHVRGLDYAHLALSQLQLQADSLYYCDNKLRLKVRQGAFAEKSGLVVNSLQGAMDMDSLRLSLSRLQLQTQAGTQIALDYAMDMNAFADSLPGHFRADARGQVGRRDLMLIVGSSLPADMRRHYPNKPLVVAGRVHGNLQQLRLKDMHLAMPGVFKGRVDGFMYHLTRPERLRADLDLHARTQDLSFVSAMLSRDLRHTLRIPQGIGFDGRVRLNGSQYSSTFVATQGGGSMKGNVSLDARRMAYHARLSAHAFPIQHFLPHQQLRPFSGDLTLHGNGTDMMAGSTQLTATTHIRRFGYAGYSLDGIDGTASIRRGHILADIHSRNHLLRGNITVNALTSGRLLRGTVSADITHADLYGLRLADQPMSVALCGHVDLASDLRHHHEVRGLLSDITLRDKDKVYRPEDVQMDIITAPDTTHAIVHSGDFHLNMDASGGYERLLSGGNRFVAELQKQLHDKYIDQGRLRARLPEARIYLTSGKDNIIGRLLGHYGYALDNVYMDMVSSPVSGLNGRLSIDSLVVDSFQVDTVRFDVHSDDSAMTYTAQLRNGKQNPRYVFNALLDGAINERGTSIRTRIYDANDKLGVRIALQGSMEANGISLHLFDDNPILGYKEFDVNDSNYVFLGDDRRVRANMVLQAKDGMGVQIQTNDGNTEALQDVTISMNRFNLGQALSVIPYTPNVTGILDGDFHLIQTDRQLSLSSSVSVSNMTYEGSKMGNIGTEFTYMPREDGGHYVDGILLHEGNEVGTLQGTYLSKGEGVLDATLDLNRLPVSMANGFIPEKIIGFRGYAEGALTLRGSLSHPDVNGEVYLDSTYMFSEPYGVEMRFANDPVVVRGSRLEFENFEVFSHNNSPLNVQGYFDFADTDRMRMDVRMRADNYLLIDSRETARSDAYGKAYVNFRGTMTGLLSNLQMRGKLDVLGTTDLKYNLKDSPLSNDNQLEGLVEFVDFKDTTEQVISRPPLTGFNMDLSLSIDEGAHVDCYLNADHSNYIDIVGGGDMRMQYNVVDGVRLRGRYTIGGGEMKYSLPVIPLKTFVINDGSYIEFAGDPMNPRLSLTATETARATVEGDTGEGRSVEFECGVVVTKTLQDMGLEFIIDAPEDMTIHNQLQVMSKEERGKIAVTMLTTGMYLADGNTKGFTMNSALSAFLNSQINQISSKALRTLDVSIGVDNSINSAGGIHTDYSFKFAKRFWNNRLRIVIGGKLSSGTDMPTDNDTFFDNVTFEYRLSPTSNKYLNLFYKRDDYDWLEGNVGRFGGGFMWKRKLNHFSDIFRWKSDDSTLPAPTDSARKDTTIRH